MKRAFLLMAMTALAACGSEVGRPASTVSNQMNRAAVKVVRTHHVQAIEFVPGSAALAAGQDLSGLPRQNAQAVEAAWIYAPAQDRSRERRVRTLTRLLRSQGLESGVIRTELEQGGPANLYRIEYVLGHLAQPVCPDWSSPASGTYDNMPFSNHGCSVLPNIAAQMASPADWEHGRGAAGMDTRNATGVVEQYHAPTPAAAASSTQAAEGAANAGGSMAGGAAASGAQ